MAKNVIIDLKINTQDGVKSVGEVNKEMQTTLTTMREMEDAAEAITQKLKDTAVGTDEYKKLSEQLINVNTELKNQQLALESLDHEQVASELKSVAGGFTDMAGGMALVGAGNESLEKVVQTIAKVEGATKIVTGAMEAYSSVMKLQGTIAKVTTGWTNALAAAQLKGGITAKVASVGMGILNAVMALNPVFLIIIALAALVAGLAWFMSSTDEAAEKNKEFNKTFDKLIETQERAAAIHQKLGQQRLDQAKAEGKSEEELHNIRLTNLRDLETDRKNAMKVEKFGIKEQQKLYRLALEEGNEEEATAIKEQIAEKRKMYNTLEDQNGDYNAAKKLENTNYQNTLDDDNEAEVKKDEQKNKDKLNNYKKYIGNRRNASKTLGDIEQALNGDEITANDLKYDRLIASTKQSENILQSEKKKIIDGYEKLRKIDEDKIILKRAKVKKASDKKISDDAAKVDAKMFEDQDAQFALLQDIQAKNELEREINNLVISYDEKFKLATGNAELELALEKDLQDKVNEIRDVARKEQSDKETEAIKLANAEKLTALKATADAISSVVQESLNGGFDSINEAFAGLNESLFNEETGLFAKMKNGTLTAMDAVTIGIQLTMDIVNSAMEASAEKASAEREKSFSAESAALQASLNNREISQKEFDAKIKMLEDKKANQEKQARLKAFKQQKAMAIANAIMGGAQAVINGFSSQPFLPVGLLMGALATGLIAAQIGIIGSQKFTGNRGGVVPGTASKVDSVDAELAPGEAVINSESSMMFPQLLSQINQAGGGIPLAPEPVPSLTGGRGNDNVFDQGGNQMLKAYVVESEMTNSQNRVGRMERSAEF